VLEVIAGRRARRGWWNEYADVFPADMCDFLGLETAASRLLVYESQRIPALLQSETYAQEMASSDADLPAGSQHRAAEAVMIRQQAVLDQGQLWQAIIASQPTQSARPHSGWSFGLHDPSSLCCAKPHARSHLLLYVRWSC